MTTKTFTWPASTKFFFSAISKILLLYFCSQISQKLCKELMFFVSINLCNAFGSYYLRLFEKPGAIWKLQARTEVTQTPWERDTNQSQNHDWWVFVLFWKGSEALLWRRMLKILCLAISSQYLNIGVFSLYIFLSCTYYAVRLQNFNICLWNIQQKCYFTVENVSHLLQGEREKPLPAGKG